MQSSKDNSTPATPATPQGAQTPPTTTMTAPTKAPQTPVQNQPAAPMGLPPHLRGPALMPTHPPHMGYPPHPGPPFMPFPHHYGPPPFMYGPPGQFVRPGMGEGRPMGMMGSGMHLNSHGEGSSTVKTEVPRPPSSLPNNSRTSSIAQWLVQNFEIAEGLSLPRQTVYEQYEEFCRQTDQDPINAASFGKLIRAIFPSLKTRRLGTRGNSKYHYYGIRIKPSSTLPQYKPPQHSNTSSQNHTHHGPAGQPPPGMYMSHLIKMESGTPGSNSLGDTGGTDPLGFSSGASAAGSMGTPELRVQANPTQLLPLGPFPEANPELLSPGVTLENVHTVMLMYQTHSQRLLDTVAKTQFAEVEGLLRHFWQGFPKRLLNLLSCPHVIDLIRKADIMLCETMVSALVPDVQAGLSSHVIKAMRQFAKQLEAWLVAAMAPLKADKLLDAKCAVFRDFCRALRRHTSLNHLAQAARGVLVSSPQVQQMREDWSRVDHQGVKKQAVAFCKCQEKTMTTWGRQFERLMAEEAPLEKWTTWLGHLVDRLLGHPGGVNYGLRARQLVLNWSFICSLYIRDLTLRSSKSFGSFHLMRLLLDEYMSYLIERRLALPKAGPPYPTPSPFANTSDLDSPDNPKNLDVMMFLSNQTDTDGPVSESEGDSEADQGEENGTESRASEQTAKRKASEVNGGAPFKKVKQEPDM